MVNNNSVIALCVFLLMIICICLTVIFCRLVKVLKD